MLEPTPKEGGGATGTSPARSTAKKGGKKTGKK